MIERRVSAGPGRVAHIRFTDRHDGDFRIDRAADELALRRRRVVDLPWTWLRQVHGADVVEVDQPGAGAGRRADGAVTECVDAVLAVQTADCAPVVLVGNGGVGVAHAGWRGVLAGVIESALTTMRTSGCPPSEAWVGPTIRPGHYEFGEDDLAAVEAAAGPGVRSTTAAGQPALDLAAAVAAVLVREGVERVVDLGIDTADDDYFSHRCRSESARQVTTVHMEAV